MPLDTERRTDLTVSDMLNITREDEEIGRHKRRADRTSEKSESQRAQETSEKNSCVRARGFNRGNMFSTPKISNDRWSLTNVPTPVAVPPLTNTDH